MSFIDVIQVFSLLSLNIFHTFCCFYWCFEQVNVSWFTLFQISQTNLVFGGLVTNVRYHGIPFHSLINHESNMIRIRIPTCSNPTMETPEPCLKSVLKINNKDTRRTSMTSFWCLYC